MDLYVWTYADDGQVENGSIGIQVKATDRLTRLADGRTISCRVDTADMVYWRREEDPVILVVYDAAKDRAYWLDVRAAARAWQPDATAWRTRTVALRIPMANRLTMHAMRQFRRWKNARYASDESNPPAR